MIDFSIIVPCRDEDDNVEIILNNIQKNCIYQSYEIIFIDDYSQDNTLNKIKEFSTKHQNIFYYINKKKGLGGAISLGLKKAQGKYITIMMADSADSIDDLNSYFKIIQENEFDAIFGSRFIYGSEIIDYPKFKLVDKKLSKKTICKKKNIDKLISRYMKLVNKSNYLI